MTTSNISAIQRLAASRQALRDVLHTANKKKNVRKQPKTQQVVRTNSTFAQPALQVKKTRSNIADARQAAIARAATGKTTAQRLKSMQQARAVLGAWLLRRWMKQPAHIIVAAVTPAIQRGIRKRPLAVLGLAAAGGALLVALQVWRAKMPYQKKSRTPRDTAL